jgi:MFS family permease
MKLFLLDGFFVGSLETIILHYLPLFALAYGASNGQIGLLGAAASLGAATASLPGAWLSSKWRYRKPFVLLTRGGGSHLLLLLFALLPLVAGQLTIVAVIIAAATMRSFVFFMGEGAWTSLAADLVPEAMRGRFFGSRNLLIGLGGLAGVGSVALLLAGLGPGSEWTAVWLVALAMGIGSSVLYSRIPERELADQRSPQTESGGLLGVFKDYRFRRFGVSVVVWNVSLYMAAPFFNVHLVKNLGASPLWVGGLLAVAAGFGLVGQTAIGRMVDSRGARRVIVLCGTGVAMLPLMWYFVTAPWQVIGINAAGGVLWAGYLLATFSFLLAISPPGQQRYYAAAYATLVYLSTTLGPLLGGALAAAYGIKATFIASGVGRVAATALLAALVREESPRTLALPEPRESRVAAVAAGRSS